MKLTTAAAALALAAGANAQFSIAGLSAGCTSTFAGFILGDLSSCLQITELLPVINSGGNSSVVDPLNGYLTSLCASSTPTCSNSSLTSAASSVRSGCQQELADQSSIANLFLTVVENYTPIKTAACSKNATNNEFCAADALNTIQNVSGEVTFNTITALLGGDGSATQRLQDALGTGELCTGCVAGIYNAALQVNGSIATSSIGQAVTQQCGANFASNTSGVATPSVATPSPSSSQAAQSTTNNSGATAMSWSAGALAAAVLAVAVL
ncbi:unnamed protein product [Cutaneotrichosporon oleaginosum]